MRHPNQATSPPARLARRIARRMLELLAGAILGAITIAAWHALQVL